MKKIYNSELFKKLVQEEYEKIIVEEVDTLIRNGIFEDNRDKIFDQKLCYEALNKNLKLLGYKRIFSEGIASYIAKNK
jgi:hypothetical protein